MEYQENIIQIRKRDIRQADLAFDDFMKMTENAFNEKAKCDIQKFKKCEGKELEIVTEKILKEIAPSTPFRSEDIMLVSGARFPDIQAGRYYGIEVKSTKSNTWSSTGSSIIESTRIPDISNIYMLFGKLGGDYAEFRCRPYEECLSNIAVTHSPRYLIDMTLADNNNQTIFNKMQVDYDTFRLLNEKEKIHYVREYYKNTRRKHEMPWWIDCENSEESTSMMIRFFCDLDIYEKEDIISRALILFPEIFEKNSDKYKRTALWMCSRYSIINSSLRDVFSAGGKVTKIGGISFKKAVPQILHTLYLHKNIIIQLLNNPDKKLCDDICDFWETKNLPNNLYDFWIKNIQEKINNNPELKGIKIKSLFEQWQLI